MKAATSFYCSSVEYIKFQSTPPVKAATYGKLHLLENQHISIHAAREGGDAFEVLNKPCNYHISIHAAREGGDWASKSRALIHSMISIHAAREGGDLKDWKFFFHSPISIHAAREGGDGGIT